MSYTSWFVGMEVVCRDATARSPYSRQLREGAVYRIAAIQAGQFLDGYYGTNWVDGVGIKLVELEAPETGWFNVARFRPVQTRKTDISIFRRLLTNPHVRIEEDA